jgi:hypothetical protein
MQKKYYTEQERKEAIKLKNAKAYQKNKEYHKNYREENFNKIAEYHKEYYDEKNPEIKLRKEFNVNNPEIIKNKIRANKRLYQKNKRNNDPIYKLKANTRTIICNIFKNRGYLKKEKTSETEMFLGATD